LGLLITDRHGISYSFFSKWMWNKMTDYTAFISGAFLKLCTHHIERSFKQNKIPFHTTCLYSNVGNMSLIEMLRQIFSFINRF
jgi:hypothetical protein